MTVDGVTLHGSMYLPPASVPIGAIGSVDGRYPTKPSEPVAEGGAAQPKQKVFSTAPTSPTPGSLPPLPPAPAWQSMAPPPGVHFNW
jgi:hypothetical protein